MPEYDRERFAPPAPVAMVRILHPDSGASVDRVPMLVDTGADATLLPRAVVESLGITPLREKYRLLSFDDTVSEAEAVRGHLVFSGRNFRGTFLVIDANIGVLGRNVLNNVWILLDGPAQMWTEVSAPAKEN